jgi:hypothetical protein
MSRIVRDLPAELLSAFGIAHGAERRQSIKLADAARDLVDTRLQDVVSAAGQKDSSVDRFKEAMAILNESYALSASAATDLVADGRLTIVRRARSLQLKVASADSGFAERLEQNSEELFRKCSSERTEGKDALS